MLKRFLSIFLAFVISVPLSGTASAAAFRDTAGTRYGEAAEHLAGKGAIQGYSDGRLRPFAAINRVEAIKTLLALQQPLQARVNFRAEHMPPLPLFIDLDEHAWYMPYVETAFEAKLITGYPDRTFKPRKSLTIEEAIALILRAYHEDGFLEPVQISPSISNWPGQWYTRFVNAAIDKNLLSNAEQFELGRQVTRGQFFDIAYRMDIVRGENLARFNRPESFPPLAPRIQTQSARQYRVVTPPRPVTPIASNGFFISIPGLGIQSLRVSHTSDMSHQGLLAPLKYGVGHMFGYPGAGGKILIYGHSSSYSWDISPYTKIFRQINRLKQGDLVDVTYNGKAYQYRVSSFQSVPAADMSPYRGGGSEELLLYTCWPPDSIKFRYLVHAVPVR